MSEAYQGTRDCDHSGRPVFPDHVLGVQPAAGAGFVFPLDATWDWRFVSCRFTLATDVNAANRFVSVDYCDSEGTVWIRNAAALVLTANTAAQEFDFLAGRGASEWAANTPILSALEKVWLPRAWQLRINVANVQAGDQLAAIRMYVEKRTS